MPLLNQPDNLNIAELPVTPRKSVLKGGRFFSNLQDLRAGFKAKTIFHSLGYALEGLTYVTRTQRNFRIHLCMATAALTLAIVFQISIFEMALICGLIGLVLFAELMNTVIELFVDLVTDGRFDLRAKAIKDMAAGAVFVTASSALACGCLIFAPRILQLFSIS